MKYEFPQIKTLSDVLPAIEGRTEFVVAKREGFTVVNYVVAMDDTFPPIKTAGGSAKQRAERALYNAIRRECRGLIFDNEGKIISRRLHKFFNVNEREETLIKNIDFSKHHVIIEKLDGSMVTPIKLIDSRGVYSYRWGTKMGLTDVAKPVEDFVYNNPNYQTFADLVITCNLTPIFEWCSRKQRIVVEHPVDRLVLIAIRDTVSGAYMPYNDMVTEAKAHGIDYVRAYPLTVNSLQQLVDEIKNVEGMEGWVVRFDDGHMVKIKGEWYLRIHKIKDSLSQEKNIIDLIVNEKIDDAKAFMLEDDRKRVEEFERKFWKGFDCYVQDLTATINIYKKVTKGNRKEFAICSQNLNGVDRSIAFSVWDNDKSIREELLNVVKKNISTQTRVDNIRYVWYNHKWNYNEVTENE